MNFNCSLLDCDPDPILFSLETLITQSWHTIHSTHIHENGGFSQLKKFSNDFKKAGGLVNFWDRFCMAKPFKNINHIYTIPLGTRKKVISIWTGSQKY